MLEHYINDFLKTKDATRSDFEIEVEPVIAVSVRRLHGRKRTISNVICGDLRYYLVSEKSYSMSHSPHQVDIVLRELPELNLMRGFQNILGCPQIAFEISQVCADPFGVTQFDKIETLNGTNFDIWPEEGGEEDSLYKSSFASPLVEDRTDSEYWKGLPLPFFRSEVWRHALRELVNAQPELMKPYVARALTLKLIQRWLLCRRDFDETCEVFSLHRSALIEIYRSNLRYRLSGETDTEKVLDRMAKFLRREAISAAHCETELDLGTDARNLASELIELIQSSELAKTSHVAKPVSDGLQLERQVADNLANIGFEVVQTKATGDFGADLIAESGNLRFSIQCKDVARPVGVKAVQEAVAAVLP